jgi:hypothetical protein
MARFHVHDVRSIESTPATPASLRSKIGEMILNSSNPRARVESLNAETGEYRVVLQGTLVREEDRLEEK